MDYEKAYKEALKRAKYCKEGISDRKLEAGENIMDYIFPELEESKDEKIRREMIEIIKNEAHEFPSSVIANKSNSWIAWLEKQGEKANIYQDTEDDLRRQSTIQVLEYARSLDAYNQYGKESINKDIAWLEKQGETQDKGEISDGYHTFNELYYYRMLYNAAFFNMLPKEWVHKSKKHYDGEECFGGGWFIVMANLPTGQISNHYELKDWDLFQIPEKEVADKWDGHTPQEAADRLYNYLLETQGERKPVGGNERETEINLVEILKHYPRETELYSPLYGKLWLAEVDEEHEIITCYKHHLDEGCTRAILEQEDTVSFYSNGTIGLPDFNVSEDCMLFLYGREKQGEQKENQYITITQKILDYINKYESSFENGIPKLDDSWKVIKISKYPGVNGGKPVVKVVNEDNGDWMRLPLDIIDIKIEQNSADDIKPKFKVGDWIIKNDDSSINIDYSCCKITKVENGNYTIESIYGYKGYNTFETFEKDYHLWTIEDAKDGDVLAAHETIVLFKKIEGQNIRCYCTYHYLGFNPTFYVGTLQNKNSYCPATKEQHDFIFQKMKEAGYEWDVEKLELRKKEPDFKPFDKVLVRDFSDSKWIPALYGFKVEIPSSIHIVSGGGKWKLCIPYEGNEHLLGTTENCE